MAIVYATDENFRELTAEGPVVVDFFSKTCVPCKMLAKVLEEVDDEFPFVNIVKVDIDDCPKTAEEFAVSGIPDIYDKLHADELDCAIVSYSETRCQGLSFVPLRDDPLVAILPGLYKPNAQDFPVTGFRGQEFLMPSAGFEADITPIFGQSMDKVAARVRYTNLDDAAIVSMVEHKLGVSILSELVVQDMNYHVRVLPLDPPCSRHLGIAMAERRRGDHNIQRFVRCAQTVVPGLYAAQQDQK